MSTAPSGSKAWETSLYAPVKRFIERLGFVVKGEIGGCDLVAFRGDEAPVVIIGGMKLSLHLGLILHAVDRCAASDEVWLAAPMSAPGHGRRSGHRLLQ